MRKFAFLVALVLASFFAACGLQDKPAGSNKVSIVATIFPQYDWLRNILGEYADRVDLKLLIKNGTDLHSYEPSALDIASIASADLVVYVGGESDEWIEKALAATPKAGRVQVNLMKALGDRVKEEEVIEGMQSDPGEDGEGPENDEHIWLSLKNAEILVKSLAQTLAKIDTANASIYRANAILYASKIHDLDWAYDSTVSYAPQKAILFGDRFPFRYMVDDYGIKYYAAFVGCSAESEASFETVAYLAGMMDSLSLPAIFTIDGSHPNVARAILNASKNSKNAPVLELNSMQSVTDEQIRSGLDYLSIMQSNLEMLKKALK
jgi:zinc transport system substrate-binding protein